MTTKNPLDGLSARQLIAGVTGLITFVSLLFGAFNQYSTITYEVTTLKKQINEMQDDLKLTKIENKQAIHQLELANKTQEIQQAKIETQLTGIDATLQEIKAKLK
jgi:hypothetical protein